MSFTLDCEAQKTEKVCIDTGANRNFVEGAWPENIVLVYIHTYVYQRTNGPNRAAAEFPFCGGSVDKYMYESIIIAVNFKVALRMCADGADIGRLLADDKVAAVAAFPHGFTGFFKDLLQLHIVQ